MILQCNRLESLNKWPIFNVKPGQMKEACQNTTLYPTSFYFLLKTSLNVGLKCEIYKGWNFQQPEIQVSVICMNLYVMRETKSASAILDICSLRGFIP